MKAFINTTFTICLAVVLLIQFPVKGQAQSTQSQIPTDTLMSAAVEIIQSAPFCALSTVDSTGQPQVRTMNPFPLKDDMVIWFATGRTSRKVDEIRNNPKVSVYFSDHTNSRGYVNITGTAEILDDKELLVKMKRTYWEGIPNWQDIFVLIKITPKTLDVINYKKGVSGDPKTSRASVIVF
jgi:general stress protein 26